MRSWEVASPCTGTRAVGFWSKLIVELKAVSALADEHRAQVINYLNATGYKLGLLVNFGHYPKLECERIVHTRLPEAASGPEPPNPVSL